MKIKSITAENFLPFKDRQELKFSTDPDRCVTLIMGNNGAGKTSLAQAFEWCLYGTMPEGTKTVLNAYTRDHLSPGSFTYATVSINLEKDGVDYFIERKQKHQRKPNGELAKPEAQEFLISYKDDGETKFIKLHELDETINRLLPEELSHYFFFDGEHIKKMRDEVERGKSSDFANAVKMILGLQNIASAILHLKDPSSNRLTVYRWFRKQFDDAGNQDIQEKQKKVDVLEKRIEGAVQDREDAEDDEAAANGQIKKWEELLQENADSEEAIKRLQKAKKLLEGTRSIRSQQQEAFFRVFRDGQYRYFSDYPIKDAREELADEDKISKGVPSVNDKTIKFLLERGECICGATFETGDEVFQHLTELLNYVPPKDLGTYISEFDKECRVRTESAPSLYDDISRAYKELKEAETDVQSAEQAVKSAQDYLDGLNHVDVAKLRANLRAAQNDKREAIARQATASKTITSARREIEALESEIKAYSAKNEKNQRINECLKYVDFIFEYLSKYYSTKESDTRETLQEVVDKYFTTIYDGELHLELDSNYGVEVIVDGIQKTEDEWRTSDGQTLSIVLAFILGVLDIAKENRQHGDELLHGDTYPLVMDAPLSDFDKERIGTICSVLPTAAEQVIIIIKDTDGELAEEHLTKHIGKRYTIDKITDYQSVIK